MKKSAFAAMALMVCDASSLCNPIENTSDGSENSTEGCDDYGCTIEQFNKCN